MKLNWYLIVACTSVAWLGRKVGLACSGNEDTKHIFIFGLKSMVQEEIKGLIQALHCVFNEQTQIL